MKRFAIVLIRAYQQCISPMLPPSCIYSPSCSSYALEAFERHGFWRGGALAARRLLRCWPWSAGGFDPVPVTHCSGTHECAHRGVHGAFRGQE